MFRLRYGYLVVGITTGCILFFNFLSTLPDGKLHITFCNVGQGDASYIRFPDGRDMLVDGGPDNTVLRCLGNHKPFWDRTLSVVILTHPEKDHMQGLIEVFRRYHVGYFVHSDVTKATQADTALVSLVGERHIPSELVTAGDRIGVGQATISVVWPSAEQIAMDKTRTVLGTTTESVNADSVVFSLHYGSFDTLFPGDTPLDREIGRLADSSIEVLKVPHHGSKTGMTPTFLDWLKPRVAVISVGKNFYGQPSPQILQMLADRGIRVLRTDQGGDITFVTDGKNWRVSR